MLDKMKYAEEFVCAFANPTHCWLGDLSEGYVVQVAEQPFVDFRFVSGKLRTLISGRSEHIYQPAFEEKIKEHIFQFEKYVSTLLAKAQLVPDEAPYRQSIQAEALRAKTTLLFIRGRWQQYLKVEPGAEKVAALHHLQEGFSRVSDHFYRRRAFVLGQTTQESVMTLREITKKFLGTAGRDSLKFTLGCEKIAPSSQVVVMGLLACVFVTSGVLGIFSSNFVLENDESLNYERI